MGNAPRNMTSTKSPILIAFSSVTAPSLILICKRNLRRSRTTPASTPKNARSGGSPRPSSVSAAWGRIARSNMPHFIHNGQLIPAAEAKIPVDNIEWTYGFGVYENLKVRNNKIYFVDKHIHRLFESARLIGLEHGFDKKKMKKWIKELKDKNEAASANIKILLIGGKKPNLYIMTLAPKFLDRNAYTQGVHTITREYERYLPQAKTLNMLPSYLFFRAARPDSA